MSIVAEGPVALLTELADRIFELYTRWYPGAASSSELRVRCAGLIQRALENVGVGNAIPDWPQILLALEWMDGRLEHNNPVFGPGCRELIAEFAARVRASMAAN